LRRDAAIGPTDPIVPPSRQSWVFDPGWVLTAQPYRRTGPLLPRPAWFLLVQALEGALDHVGLGDDLRVAAERLMVEGLLAEDGSLTGDGYLVAEILRSPVSMIRIDTMAPGHRGTMEVLLDFDIGVSLATTGPTGSHPLPRDVDVRGVAVDGLDPMGSPPGVTDGSDPSEPPALVGLEVFELGWTPATIASWTGSGPGVPWLSEPTTLPLDLLQARLTDAATPPPADLPGRIAEVWSDPWLLWELKAWPSGERLLVLRVGHRHPVLLSTGSAGGEDRVGLTPVSPYTLWRTLIALVRRALVAGADELR
jgi:hypothetical protein